MDIFNIAKESFAAASKGFTQKASDVSGIARLTLKMKEEEKQLESELYNLGVQFFQEHNEEAKTFFPELAEKIRTLYAEMEKDRVELVYLKGNKICPSCGTELPGELACCTACGMNVEYVEKPIPAQKWCPACGSQLTEGAKFCNQCGEKL